MMSLAQTRKVIKMTWACRHLLDAKPVAAAISVPRAQGRGHRGEIGYVEIIDRGATCTA